MVFVQSTICAADDLASLALITKGLASQPGTRVKRKYVWLANYHNSVVNAIIDDFRKDRRSKDAFRAETGYDALRYFKELIIKT